MMSYESMSLAQVLLLILMMIAGFCIPVMAALNADLGYKLGSPLLAVVLLCAVATCTAIILLAASPPLEVKPLWSVNVIYYLSGVLFVLYIASITYSAPRIGLGNAVFFVLLGQMLSAALIDHFGWFNSILSPFSITRASGISLMVIGVYLANKNSVF